ncbi:glycosyltransferase family 2 protein [Elusimicrobiota bacterium]
MSEITLAVIIPALNEEENIKDAVLDTVSAMDKYNVKGEVTVVNDGSTDRTREIVENLMKEFPLLKLINHDVPQGIGASFFEGAKKTDKEIVVMFPGDNETRPEDSLAFFSTIKEVDIIVPFFVNINLKTKIREFISSLYRTIINISFGVSLNYTNGTVLYRRCILEGIELRSKGFFYQAELLVKLIRKGYLYAEIPSFLYLRHGGKSKAVNVKALLEVMKNYSRLLFDIFIRRIGSKDNHKRLNPESVSFQKYLRYEKTN